MKIIKPKIYESDLQETCVQWFRIQYPDKLIFAIPNGGKRNKFEAFRLKKQGVMSGVPDLCISEPLGAYHGLYVELKVEKRKPTQNQEEVMSKLAARGYKTEVCREFEQFQTIVNGYLGLREQEEN